MVSDSAEDEADNESPFMTVCPWEFITTSSFVSFALRVLSEKLVKCKKKASRLTLARGSGRPELEIGREARFHASSQPIVQFEIVQISRERIDLRVQIVFFCLVARAFGGGG